MKLFISQRKNSREYKNPVRLSLSGLLDLTLFEWANACLAWPGGGPGNLTLHPGVRLYHRLYLYPRQVCLQQVPVHHLQQKAFLEFFQNLFRLNFGEIIFINMMIKKCVSNIIFVKFGGILRTICLKPSRSQESLASAKNNNFHEFFSQRKYHSISKIFF